MSNTKPTILVIDCQVFQTPSWHRGMGKYSYALLKQVLAEKNTKSTYTDIVCLFNSNLPSNEEVVSYLQGEQRSVSVVTVDLATPKEPRTEYSVEPVIAANKSKLNQYFATKFSEKHIDFLILALYLDEVCSAFPNVSRQKMLVYYDSIPYLYHERYGQFKGFFENFYMPHTATVYEADTLLTISKTVANDLHIIFGIPKDAIHNIDGASIPRSTSEDARPDSIAKNAPYILMPTGQELRKNNVRAVRAFEQFRLRNNLEIQLVVTSNFTEEARQEMLSISSYILFTGNVSEQEILWLYKNAQFVLFPSEYEGLGLPVLEAAEEDRLIACSDISVFREMSSSLFYYFNPLDIEDMSAALDRVYADSVAGVAKDYDSLLRKYTWKNTARSLLDTASNYEPLPDVDKKKIAIFCPDPSGFSAIGKVVTESHAWYARYFDITYFFDKGPNHEAVRPNPLPYLAPCYSVEQFSASEYEQYDAVVYHIGNSEYHLNIIHTALALPGYVILHDTYLSGAFDNLLEQGYISRQRFDLEKALDGKEEDTKNATSLFLTSLVNYQKAVVAHSNYAVRAVKERILTDNREVVVKKINLPVDTPIHQDIVRSSALKLNISFAGIIAKVKGTDIIEEIAQTDRFQDCSINIFGYAAVEPERLEKLRALSHVDLFTNPNDYAFQTLMAKTDLLINVRLAYKGETSLTTLEAMRYGATVLVRDFGWYSELPDDCVVKVSRPEDTITTLEEVIETPERLDVIKTKALNYIEANHSHKAYAEQMYKLIGS